MNKAKIIEKWYKTLNFPSLYNSEFYNALNEVNIADIKIEEYDMDEKDGRKNFLSYLYMCEELSNKYKQKGISEDILFDTLKDIERWLDIWSELKGELYLGEIGWLKYHLSMRLFKLGRLQFAFGKASYDDAEKNLKKGDNIIEVHIPAEGPLTKEECEKSFETAKKFFKEFYPDYKYKCFTCHSWLLDTTLKEFLSDSSNIIQFQNLFDVVHEEKSDSILKYTFEWNTTREKIKDISCTSGFAQRIKERIQAGRDFHISYGVYKY